MTTATITRPVHIHDRHGHFATSGSADFRPDGTVALRDCAGEGIPYGEIEECLEGEAHQPAGHDVVCDTTEGVTLGAPVPTAADVLTVIAARHGLPAAPRALGAALRRRDDESTREHRLPAPATLEEAVSLVAGWLADDRCEPLYGEVAEGYMAGGEG